MATRKKNPDGPAPEALAEGGRETLLAIPLALVKPGNNPRKTFDEQKLADLAESIRAHGQQVPALVRRVGDGFELVAGERRWRACELAGVPTLLCRLVELDDRAALEVALVENSARADVHPLEEAAALAQLIEMGSDVEDLRGRLNRGEQWVRDRLTLARLTDKLRARFAAGEMGIRAACILAHLSEAAQDEIAGVGYEWPMSVTRARRVVTSGHAIASAPWSLDDADLGGRGACAPCTYRTDVQPDLLQDDREKPLCTDRKCWLVKIDAWSARQEAAGHRVMRDRYPTYSEINLTNGAYSLKDALGVVTPPKWSELVGEIPHTIWLKPDGGIDQTASVEAIAAALRTQGRGDLADVLQPAVPGKAAPAAKPPKVKKGVLLATVGQLVTAVQGAPTHWLTSQVLAAALAERMDALQARAVGLALGVEAKALGYAPHWLQARVADTTDPGEMARLLALMILAPDLAWALAHGFARPTTLLAQWLADAAVEAPAGLIRNPLPGEFL